MVGRDGAVEIMVRMSQSTQGRHKGHASQFFGGLAKYLACVLILMHAGVSKSWNTL